MIVVVASLLFTILRMNINLLVIQQIGGRVAVSGDWQLTKGDRGIQVSTTMIIASHCRRAGAIVDRGCRIRTNRSRTEATRPSGQNSLVRGITGRLGLDTFFDPVHQICKHLGLSIGRNSQGGTSTHVAAAMTHTRRMVITVPSR